MADDLDAFFDQVSAAEAEAVTEEKDEVKEPPAKKAKTTKAPPPVRPVGIVVASAASATASSTKTTSPPAETLGGVPSRLPPLTTAAALPAGTSGSVSTAAATATTTLPPLPTASSTTNPPLPPGPPPPPAPKSKKALLRTAAGKTWVDPTLAEWPENDYRIFVGNLSPDVTDPQLYSHFAEYSSIQKAKVVRDKDGNSKGFGFVSLLKPLECAKAIREKDQSWLGARPIRTKRSDWKERSLQVQKKKQKQKKGYMR
jgi:hypothetical protein